MIEKQMSKAAGPPVLKALPEPTNKPAPIEPPEHISQPHSAGVKHARFYGVDVLAKQTRFLLHSHLRGRLALWQWFELTNGNHVQVPRLHRFIQLVVFVGQRALLERLASQPKPGQQAWPFRVGDDDSITIKRATRSYHAFLICDLIGIVFELHRGQKGHVCKDKLANEHDQPR